jgi:hypothetical protein
MPRFKSVIVPLLGASGGALVLVAVGQVLARVGGS